MPRAFPGDLLRIRADHGQSLPDDRPCNEALVRLTGEPEGTGQPVAPRALGRPPHRRVPGILNECVIWIMKPALRRTWRIFASTATAPAGSTVSGLSGTAHNAGQNPGRAHGDEARAGERVLLIRVLEGGPDSPRSPGGPPEIVPRVAALVSLAGVVAGSPWPTDPAIYAPLFVPSRSTELRAPRPSGRAELATLERVWPLSQRAPLPVSLKQTAGRRWRGSRRPRVSSDHPGQAHERGDARHDLRMGHQGFERNRRPPRVPDEEHTLARLELHRHERVPDLTGVVRRC